MSGTGVQKRQSANNIILASGTLRRKCACGQHSTAGGECGGCRKERESGLLRSAINRGAFPSPDSDASRSALAGPQFGFDFTRIGLGGKHARSGLSDQTNPDFEIKVIRPPAASQLAAALSFAGEEIDEDAEDIITADTPPADAGPAPAPALPKPAPPACSYVITYANERKLSCDGGRCGAKIVFDITGVKATGTGCPKNLEGLNVTEVVTNDHGCSPADVQGGAGCPIRAGGVVTDCTDKYGTCLGSTSQGKIPATGCTETVTQKLFVGGVLAETHLIKFPIKKSGTGCTGTVNRT